MKFFNLKQFQHELLAVINPSDSVIPQGRTEEGVDGRIVACSDRSSYIAEQYKVLRTNLYSLSPENPIKTLIITSPQPEEGKTITSCNLAVTLSLDTEKKVLLIDSDLRKPTIHNIFNLQRKPGFSDILSSVNTDIDTFIKKPTVGNLYIIPAGTISLLSDNNFNHIFR